MRPLCVCDAHVHGGISRRQLEISGCRFSAGFFPDGKCIFYPASEYGASPRVWVQDLSGGAPHPITPEKVFAWKASPDGKWLLAGKRLSVNTLLDAVLVSADNGAIAPIKGIRPGEAIIGWTSENETYVRSIPDPNPIMMHVDKLNPHTRGEEGLA